MVVKKSIEVDYGFIKSGDENGIAEETVNIEGNGGIDGGSMFISGDNNGIEGWGGSRSG